jgi:hypothetical protein
MDEDRALPSPGQENGQDRLATVEASLCAMRAWAAEVQGQVKRLHEENALLAETLANSANLDPMVGYKPTMEQQMKLFEALAVWQAGAPVLEKNHTASFNTKKENGEPGGTVKYEYASPGDVSSLARTAGVHGLSHSHHMLPGHVRTYLFHAQGGFLWCDVPILTRENRALSPIQIWSVATTSAKRLGILAVFGILPDDTDDAGNPRQPHGTTRRDQSGFPPKPAPLPAQNIRRVPLKTVTD